ncbi:MAG: hypothetical protein KAI64_05025, partial [Thermoplasmata archaeon]|nr:hypothetical protein [Thermoplasmata archaeon]
ALIGSDASNGTFSINRAGGDWQGPITIPGSAHPDPRYHFSGQTIIFNATIDDTLRGNSAILEAEYFIQCIEPEVADYGTGTPLAAVDGLFNTPVEDATWSGTLTKTSGYYTVWIHGKDSANNWGPFDTETFLVLDGINPVDTTAPEPPLNVNIALEGVGLADIRITWDASLDDPGGVDFYDIFYSQSFVTNGTGYSTLTSIAATGAPNYFYVHSGVGDGDPNSYFYYVSVRNIACGVGVNETQLAKYSRALTAGTNLVSIPLILGDESVDVVFQTATINQAWSFDATDLVDPWKSYNPAKTFNDLATVNYSKALWIDASMNSNIVVVGKVPILPSIQLQAGWNLVGYHSLLLRSVSDAMSGGPAYERIEGFDAAYPPEYLRLYTDFDNMEPGYGYWIKATTSGMWTLSN